jgi:hypothetical protein
MAHKISKGHEMFQNHVLQGLPNYIKIGIFSLQIYHLANLRWTLLDFYGSSGRKIDTLTTKRPFLLRIRLNPTWYVRDRASQAFLLAQTIFKRVINS